MPDYDAQLALLLELERRHDDVLDQLDELEQRVAKVLAEWTALREPCDRAA
jgi:hypothetical protein